MVMEIFWFDLSPTTAPSHVPWRRGSSDAAVGWVAQAVTKVANEKANARNTNRPFPGFFISVEFGRDEVEAPSTKTTPHVYKKFNPASVFLGPAAIVNRGWYTQEIGG